MNYHKFIKALSIFILMIVACKNNKSPISWDEMTMPRQLTSSGKDIVPFISPDGEHIGFLAIRNMYDPYVSALPFELWIMKKEGSEQHPIISIDEFEEGSIIVRNVIRPTTLPLFEMIKTLRRQRLKFIFKVG